MRSDPSRSKLFDIAIGMALLDIAFPFRPRTQGEADLREELCDVRVLCEERAITDRDVVPGADHHAAGILAAGAANHVLYEGRSGAGDAIWQRLKRGRLPDNIPTRLQRVHDPRRAPSIE